MLVRCFAPSFIHTSSINFVVDCGPLSVRIQSGIPYVMTQSSRNGFYTKGAVILRLRIALVNLGNRWVITNTMVLPIFVR